MKVLMISESLVGGGKERRMLEIIKGLKGCDVTIYLILLKPTQDFTDIDHLNIEIIWLQRKYKKDLLAFYKIYKLCKKINPDLIHSWGSMPSVYVIPIAKLLGIKIW